MLKKFVNKDMIFLLAICLIFLLFVMPNMRIAGFSTDEISTGLWGLYFLDGKNVEDGSSVHINILGKRFPTDFIVPYAFALPCYMLIPLFILFGINVLSLKMLSVLLSVLSLPVVYYLCNKLFNRRVAIITTLLLAISPFFIHYTRIGLHVHETILNFLFLLSILFAVLYYIKKRGFYLYLSGYLLGAGLSIKVTFFSRLLGLFFMAVLLFNKNIFSFAKTNLNIRRILGIIFSFSFGAFLFIYFNVSTRGLTFRYINGDDKNEKTQISMKNIAFNENLRNRLVQLKTLIKEEIGNTEGFPFSIKGKYLPILKQFSFLLFIIAFFFNLIYTLFFKRSFFNLKMILSIYIVYTVMFFSTAFFMNRIADRHLAMLYPFPQLIIAVFLDNLYCIAREICFKPVLRIMTFILVPLIILMPLIMNDFCSIFSYHSILKKTGGRSYWSPIIYDILVYIKANQLDKYPIYCIDYGWNGIIEFLIKEEKSLLNFDFLNYASHRELVFDKLRLVLTTHTDLYVIASPGENFKVLEEDMIKLNRKIIVDKVFYNKINEPQYYLYHVKSI